jgi:holo-[acyl-carrier protein] synthase
VIGIGIDSVEVDRFRVVMHRRPGILDRLFTDDERRYAERRRDPTERFAARFAAKEAVMKALGVGVGACKWREIEVVRAPSGAPAVRLQGGAARLGQARGVTGWRLSLTHTHRSAQAVAVALGAT